MLVCVGVGLMWECKCVGVRPCGDARCELLLYWGCVRMCGRSCVADVMCVVGVRCCVLWFVDVRCHRLLIGVVLRCVFL